MVLYLFSEHIDFQMFEILTVMLIELYEPQRVTMLALSFSSGYMYWASGYMYWVHYWWLRRVASKGCSNSSLAQYGTMASVNT